MFLISAVGSVCSDLFASSLVVTCRRRSRQLTFIQKRSKSGDANGNTHKQDLKKETSKKKTFQYLPTEMIDHVFTAVVKEKRPSIFSSIRFGKVKYSQNIVYCVIMNGRRGE